MSARPCPGRYAWSPASLATALLVALWACGGGSPSDVVLPDEVEVSLLPIEPPVPRSVGLTLTAASGRDVGVGVAGVDLQGVTGVAFELRYDPEFLEFTSAGPGGFFGESAVQGADVVEAAPGKLVGVSASSDQAAARNGSGTLLTLQFRLKQLRDAESTIVFGVPESLVYGPDGVAGQHVFTSGRLVTRIRAPR